MEIAFIGSHYTIDLRFRFWSPNLAPLRDSLYKKGFTLSTAGLLTQAGPITSFDAGPIASKGNTSLIYDPEGRRIVQLVSNTRDASVNLRELLDTLNEAQIMSREVIGLIAITAEILFSSSIEPIQVLNKCLSKGVIEKASSAIGTHLTPLAIRLTPAAMTSDTALTNGENYNISIEPLLADPRSKFFTITSYKGRKADDAVGFLSSLVDKLKQLIISLA